MFKHFLSLEWKQFFRSSYWQKSILLNLLLVFIALYFIVVFLFLGIALFSILEKEFPESNPLELVNHYLFYWFLTDLLLRFFFQKLPVMDVKPLLILPIKKNKIIHHVLTKSAFSFFNFLPLFTVIPFGISLIANGHGVTAPLTWMALMVVLTLIINYLNFIIESKSAETELSFLPIILIVSILFGLNYFEIISFNNLIASAVNSIIDSPFLIIIPILLLIALYIYNFKVLKKGLYIDSSLKSKTETATAVNMTWTRKFGDIAPFLELDLKLLWRNKRPRSALFIVIIGLLYGLFFYPQEIYKDMTAFYVFIGIFVTGIFLINFGQFIPAWDGSYYKLLMTQNIKYKEYLNSKFTLMAVSSIILFVLSIPYVYFGWKILITHFAAMIYNVGVNTHVLLYAGSFNRKNIDLDKRAAFNYQGTGAVQWLVGIPLMLLPMIIFYIPYKFINFEAGLITLVSFGILGIIFHEKIMNFIISKYKESKYQMVKAFGQNN